MATVYLARDRRHDRQVAIKVLRNPAASAAAAERFLNEIRITARLQHPHILTLHDSGDANGFLYFVTSYIDGESLRHRLLLERQLSVDAALQITRQVANALDYAHRQGVVHCDIKPENILLSGDYAIVADFGISRATRESPLSPTGQEPLGTYAYMSPEQLSHNHLVDGRADVYALGCTLYEMLAGQTPFVATTSEAMAEQHRNAVPAPISTLRPLVPNQVAAVLERALAKNPADRFSTAAQLSAALLPTFAVTPTPSSDIGWRPVVGAPEPAVAPRKWQTLTVRAGVGATILAASVVLALSISRVLTHDGRADTAPPAAEKSASPYTASVAVLPFDDIGSADNEQYFADGITDEIIAQLAAVPDLKVISRTSVAALKQSKLTLPQIADTLGVQHILEGSVRRTGTRVRVTAQLIEARTDAHVWAETFERELTDAFQVQEQIARSVSGALNSAVRGEVSRREAPRPRNMAAYDAFLQGRHSLAQWTPQSWLAAVTAFQYAIKLDSLFAPAYSALASTYSDAGEFATGGVNIYTAYAAAALLSDHAMSIDSSFADGFARRARMRLLIAGSADSAVTDFERALQLQPNVGWSHAGYANALALVGRFPEALRELELAVELDPVSPTLRITFSAVAAAAGRWDLVLREARRARGLGDPLKIPSAYEAAALMMTGRATECTNMELGLWQAFRAMCLHRAGQTAATAVLVDSLERAARAETQSYIGAHGLSLYHAWAGNAERWAYWFNRGLEISPDINFELLYPSAIYDPIRDEALFQSTIARARATIRARTNAELKRMTLQRAVTLFTRKRSSSL